VSHPHIVGKFLVLSHLGHVISSSAGYGPVERTRTSRVEAKYAEIALHLVDAHTSRQLVWTQDAYQPLHPAAELEPNHLATVAQRVV
jgi:hypothetical protein